MSDIEEESSSLSEISAEEEEGAVAVYGGPVRPYQFEPLADSDSSSEDDIGDRNHDGLTPAVLRERYEGDVAVASW